ncbi:MAG: hypothetical protein R6X10_18375 [Desulfobacterales bacterium]
MVHGRFKLNAAAGGLFFLMLVLLPRISSAYEMPKFPVHEKTEVRETEHFRIIYQKPLAEAVPLISEYCEEAYGILTRVFDWEPLEKTTVLVQDGFDTHNGWATPISHNTMSIYIAGPEPGTAIFQDGNYIRRTIFHEMTHLISTDIRIGYSRVLSSVFGKVSPVDAVSMGLFLFTSSPVMLAPRWFLEGLSIWSETEFCPPGRGRSTYADMVFRCAVRDDNLLPYSRWYIETPTWPYGEGAYLYGMKFFQRLYESSPKKNSVGEVTQHLAGSFLFNIDSATQKTIGKPAWELAEEMLANETADQKAKLEHLNNFILTENKRLTPSDLSAHHPVFAGGRIFFLGMEPENRESLYAYDLKKQETEKIAGTRSTSVFGSMTASKDGRYVYYTLLEVQRNENVYAEIRKFDTKENRDTLVTESGRYTSIDISPDGTKIAAVSQRRGRSHLLLLDLDKEDHIIGEKVLSVKPLFTILSTPRFSPCGSRIAFTETREDGYGLKIFNLDTAVETNIYQSKSQILTPDWHPLKNLLVFSSDMNGVYNLFHIKAEENCQPVSLTHVTGGLFSPAVSKQAETIAAIGYDSKGPYLTIIPYPLISIDVSVLPNIGPSWRNGKTKRFLTESMDNGSAETETGIGKSLTAPKTYHSFTEIQPDFWSPYLEADSYGIKAGIGVFFSDPAGYQNLSLSGGYAAEHGSMIGAAHYVYRGIYPHIHLYGLADQEYYSDLLVDQYTGRRFDHAEEVIQAGAAFEFPYIKMERQISLKLGYEFTKREVIEEEAAAYRNRTLSIYPTEEDEGGVWARISYFDGTEFKSSSSIEDGRYVSIAADIADEALGGGYDRKRFTSEWREYISMPWLKNHVFVISGFYGFGDGDRVAQGYFGLGGGQGSSYFQSDAFGISRNQSLRGYTENYQTGESIAKTMAAYRFPVFNFFKGYGNRFPSYLRQISCEVFYEGGRTWNENGNGDHSGWISAIGTEANFSMTLLRYLNFAPGLGVAYAPDKIVEEDEESKLNVYVSIKGWISF